MKKFYKLLICFICIIGLVGCGKDDPTIVSISINQHSLPSEISVYDFDYTTIELLVKYSDDSSSIVYLEEYMFNTTELAKLSKIGKHTITINYEGETAQFLITLIEEAPVSRDPQTINYNAVVYSTTSLTDNGIKMDFNITGKGQFSAFQFTLKYNSTDVVISSIVVNEKLIGIFEYVNNSGEIKFNYTQDVNQTTDTFYFTIYFTSEKMYNNFYQEDTATFLRIIDNEIFSFNSSYFLLDR